MSDLQPRQLRAGHVGRVYRQLSDEHIETRLRDERDAIWRALAQEGATQTQGLARRHALPGSGGLWPWLLAAAGAAAVLSLGWVATSFLSADRLAYAVVRTDGQTLVGSREPDPEGDLIATAEEPVIVRLSDESRLELAPHTAIRLSARATNRLSTDVGRGAEGRVVVRLAQGRLRADVHHRDTTDYRFQTGAFEVKVVGTAFDLAYDSRLERFDLTMHEGRVLVTGPGVLNRSLSRGERLTLPEQAEAALTAQQTSSPVESIPLAELQATDSSVATRAGSDPGSPRSPEHLFPGVSLTYRELAQRGAFKAIVRAAQHEGLERVLSSKAPAELHELGQAARYTGDVALAERVFSLLEQKYSGTNAGRNATFFKGRLAEDRGRLSDAIARYDAYLQRDSRGAYAAEALGRKLAIVQRTRGSASALPIAQEYLRRFPQGAYRKLAQTLATGEHSGPPR